MPVDDRTAEWTGLLLRGGDFILDQPAVPPAVWGQGSNVLWSEGEGMMVCGPQGVGKSALVQNLVLARAGLREPEVVGFPVAHSTTGPVLYLALDRPLQIARSMRRMVEPRQRVRLNQRVRIWRGPLPFDPTVDVAAIADLAEAVGATTVVVDSYKDLAPAGLVGDEAGSAINLAVQHVVQRGIEWVGIHHQRKANNENRHPRALDDVYGSRWLTSGLGSVLLLWGAPGDERVELLHLKQPAERVGPLALRHDKASGLMSLVEVSDPLALLVAAGPTGVDEVLLASQAYGADHPAARRRLRLYLRKLESEGAVHLVTKAVKGGKGGGGAPAVWAVLR